MSHSTEFARYANGEENALSNGKRRKANALRRKAKAALPFAERVLASDTEANLRRRGWDVEALKKECFGRPAT